jgi:hypothetical protein
MRKPYECEFCRYTTPRSANLKRHVKSMHKAENLETVRSEGAAHQALFQNAVSISLPLGLHASPVHQKRSGDDPFESVNDIIEKHTRTLENFNRFTKALGLAVPRTVYVPYLVQTGECPISRIGSVDTFGWNLYKCRKCQRFNISALLYSSDSGKISETCGLHDCSANTHAAPFGVRESSLDSFVQVVKDWTLGSPTLYASQLNPLETVPNGFRSIDLGEIDETGFFLEILRCEGLLDSDLLKEFLTKTGATCCICKFKYKGEDHSYFMAIRAGQTRARIRSAHGPGVTTLGNTSA